MQNIVKNSSESFNKLIIKLGVLVLGIMFLYSCGTDDSSGKSYPRIYELSPNTTFPGNIVTIYGECLGMTADSSFILIDSNIKIYAKACIKWNNAKIEFYLPDSLKDCKIRVIANKDTSNALPLSILKTPVFDMVEVAAGTFNMGSEYGLDDELPVHKVAIGKKFMICKDEVSVLLWNFVNKKALNLFDDPKIPVSNVSWDDAVAFCNKLSKIYGYDTVYKNNGSIIECDTLANGFQLPTEAEWEYACRAGSVSDISGDGLIDNMAWYALNSGYKVHPSENKKANAWGIYDMHGNLWEWCWDYYAADYYTYSPTYNPRGPVTGSQRIVRGGSAFDGSNYARSSSRMQPVNAQAHTGLRLIRKNY